MQAQCFTCECGNPAHFKGEDFLLQKQLYKFEIKKIHQIGNIVKLFSIYHVLSANQ